MALGFTCWQLWKHFPDVWMTLGWCSIYICKLYLCLFSLPQYFPDLVHVTWRSGETSQRRQVRFVPWFCYIRTDHLSHQSHYWIIWSNTSGLQVRDYCKRLTHLPYIHPWLLLLPPLLLTSFLQSELSLRPLTVEVNSHNDMTHSSMFMRLNQC